LQKQGGLLPIQFVKQCILVVTEEVCLDRENFFEGIGLSTQTCARRTEVLGANLFEQLKMRANSFDCYALAMNESSDITDTVSC
jgi:hypothetical protein